MARKKKVVAATQKPFPVLDLPPEIRNRIWRFVVVTDEPVKVIHHGRAELAGRFRPSKLRSGKEIESHRKDDIMRCSSILTVAFTCRRAYLEITPIYYSKNTFLFDDGNFSPMAAFTTAIGQKNAQSITFASLVIPHWQRAPDMACLSGLQRLDVEYDCHWRRPLYHDEVARLDCLAKSNPHMAIKIDGESWESVMDALISGRTFTFPEKRLRRFC